MFTPRVAARGPNTLQPTVKSDESVPDGSSHLRHDKGGTHPGGAPSPLTDRYRTVREHLSSFSAAPQAETRERASP
jgi:hypothetical protein